jgi:putative transposase
VAQPRLLKGGRAFPQQSKLRREGVDGFGVRYEREHSMSLWHTDWKLLPDGSWCIAYMDDASRLITGYGSFEEAKAENAISVLEKAIGKYGCPKEILMDQGDTKQFARLALIYQRMAKRERCMRRENVE